MKTAISIEIGYEENGESRRHALSRSTDAGFGLNADAEIGMAIAEFISEAPVDPMLAMCYAMIRSMKLYPDELFHGESPEADAMIRLERSVLEFQTVLFNRKDKAQGANA
jgi:hypothetical protein